MYTGYDEDSLRVAKFEAKQSAKLLEWKVSKDMNVAKGAILFVYEESGVEKKYKSNFVGTIVEIFIEENCTLTAGDDVLLYQICLHPTVMKDMCAECGEDLRESHISQSTRINAASVSMIHSVPELRVSVEHAQKLGKADVSRLIAAKKLVLLVDLDQTLIHTTYENVFPNLKDVSHFQLYGTNTPWYHTKMRPHTEQFLQNVSQMYELHICTFGARMYAHKIASLLDPTEKLFYNRILSRDECFDPNSKTGNLKALFPCGDSMVCIIDDREDVWNFSPNVVAVKPYLYFKNTGDINSPYKPDIENFTFPKENQSSKGEHGSEAESSSPINSEKESNKSEAVSSSETEDKCENCDYEDDDYLLYLEDILKRVHIEFFKLYETSVKNKLPDLKEIVPILKKRTLDGVRLVFSGVIPTNTTPEKSKMWILAESFGAKVQNDIVVDKSPEENTTHVIAAKSGTVKVNKAMKYGIKIVNPQWLLCAAERWEHVEEKLFPLENSSHLSDQEKMNVKIVKKEQRLVQTTDNVPLENISAKVTFPVYDPVTGKRINLAPKGVETKSQPLTKSSKEEVTDEVEPHNMLDLSPLSAFSKNDLRMMDKEVDDACSEGDEMSTGNTDSSADEDDASGKQKRKLEDLSSDESLCDEFPRGWDSGKQKKQRQNEDEETRESFVDGHSSNSSDAFNESIGSVDEEMAAAVEREFLS